MITLIINSFIIFIRCFILSLFICRSFVRSCVGSFVNVLILWRLICNLNLVNYGIVLRLLLITDILLSILKGLPCLNKGLLLLLLLDFICSLSDEIENEQTAEDEQQEDNLIENDSFEDEPSDAAEESNSGI